MLLLIHLSIYVQSPPLSPTMMLTLGTGRFDTHTHTHTHRSRMRGGLCNTNENETAIITKETKAQSVVSLSISAAGREMHGKLNATLGAAPSKVPLVLYISVILRRDRNCCTPCLCSTSVYMMFTLQQKPDGASDFTCEYTLARKGVRGRIN